MHHKLLAAAAMAALLLFAPARATASCCDQSTPQHAAQRPEIGDAMDIHRTPEPVVLQVMEVWFHRPVRVGTFILQGRYVIEHSTRRMARGEPCTYIYAYDDQRLPVAAFACTHLTRNRASANTVVLVSFGDGLFKDLAAFQFAGETAAHGVPTGR